ncbi:MAG TPA: OsmC family protein [Vicinamibacterales bacterium]|nr:OsmC family protein [Vicinamibacterales bacterium]
MAEKPPAIVELVWEHDLVLSGRSGAIRMTLDSASAEGPSPMQALAFALAACMAMDVVHVIRKGRHDLRGLRTELTGHRAQEDPRRFTRIELVFTITGHVPAEVVERAIRLSREKYCSVWHSMREDIELAVSHAIGPGV